MQRRLVSCAAAATLCAAAALAAAQPLPQTLYSCAGITRDSERLACFDREIAALSHEAAPHTAVAATAGAAPTTPAAALPSPDSVGAAAPAATAVVPSAGDLGAGAGAAGATGAPLTPEQKLGLSPEGIRKLEAKQAIKSAAVKGLTAHITSVSRNAAGRMVFTLDNGQIWRQAETRSSFEAAPGDVATISSGALGSFWLATSKHNWTRVERIP
jgi:hypothetical protein